MQSGLFNTVTRICILLKEYVQCTLRKESVNNDGQQFHPYQQNEQSTLTSTNGTYKNTMAYDVGNPGACMNHINGECI